MTQKDLGLCPLNAGSPRMFIPLLQDNLVSSSYPRRTSVCDLRVLGREGVPGVQEPTCTTRSPNKCNPRGSCCAPEPVPAQPPPRVTVGGTEGMQELAAAAGGLARRRVPPNPGTEEGPGLAV